MADWKVSAERVKVLPHPGADKLLLLKVGGYQLVASVDTGYEDGDLVVFAPERSIIPEEIRGNYTNSETGFSYLGGPHQDRVKRIRLRGEYSDGVTVDPAWVEDRLGMNLGDLGIGKDLSALLGFARYEPPIPMGMEGVVAPLPPHTTWTTHDVEQFRIYADQFVAGEDVVITEKIHGSLITAHRKPDTSVLVASKGHAKYHRSLVESESNLYWRAARQEDLFYRIARTPALAGAEVQVFGEVIPCQKGFTYGITIAATLRLFKVVVDGAEWPLSRVRHEAPMLAHLWVPVLYEGPYDPEAAVAMAEGKETVSGKALHIREGVVLAPATPRRSSEGFPLKLKLINSKYKEDPEAPT